MTDLKCTKETYEEMLHEHAKMRSLLDELKQILFERVAGFSEVSSRLVLLQALVEEHFRTEEGSGCFADLISHAPHVSDKVELLIVEHAELKVDIDQLVARSSNCQGATLDWDEVRADYEEFVEKLMQHEAVENELLQAVFTEDIGSKD